MTHLRKTRAHWLSSFRALAVSLVLSLVASPIVNAAEPVALEQGERAPFAGILMPLENAAKLGERVESCELRLSMGERLAIEKERLRESSSEAVLHLERSSCSDKQKLLQSALADAQEDARREWWEQPEVIGTIGALLGAGVVVGAVFLVGQLRPAIPE